MILIGQYDSPFVRRVAIACRLYGIDFEHQPWSVFGDAARIEPYNPLKRVPTLVLDTGESLIESAAILDHLDELAGPEKAMIPERGVERRATLKVCALATGMADKAVSLVYERVLHSEKSPVWVERCNSQVSGVLGALDKDRATRSGAFWFGGKLSHADIAVACALRFTREALPGFFDDQRWPALAAHGERCEGLDVFREISQPLNVPS